jgi:hypothetical protein
MCFQGDGGECGEPVPVDTPKEAAVVDIVCQRASEPCYALGQWDLLPQILAMVAAPFEAIRSSPETVYKHTEVSLSMCVGGCLGIGMQGGHVYLQQGVGCCSTSLNIGIAEQEYQNRPCHSEVVWAGPRPIPVGGYIDNQTDEDGSLDNSGGVTVGVGFPVGAATVRNTDIVGNVCGSDDH